jgi:hypothetical protein
MKKTFILLCILLLLSGCNKEDGLIRDAVIKYNKLLSEGYRTLNMNSIHQAATEEQAMKAYHHMSALGEAGLKMNAELRDLKFIRLKLLTFDAAEIRTAEKWDYVYLDINSNKSMFDNSVDYNIKYVVRKRQDSWIVSDVVIEKAIEKKSSKGIFERMPGENAKK